MNVFKKTLLVSALAGASVAAHAEFSGNVGATTDYVWRGVSQSGGSASVSGGFDLASDAGFYAGTWVGSLSEGAGSEVDLYLGLSGGDMVAYDVGYVYYAYPSIDDIDFGELYGSLGFGPATVGVAYTINSQGDDDSDLFVEGDLYYYVSLGGEIGMDLSLSGTVGHYAFENDDIWDADYNHYQIDLTKSTEMGDFTLSLSDTDIDGDDAVAIFSWGTGF